MLLLCLGIRGPNDRSVLNLSPRLFYVLNEDWAFLLNRLPMAGQRTAY